MRGDEKTGYVTDQCDYENLIRWYEEKEAGEPLFLFNVTMQNHSAYQMAWTNLPREVWLTGRWRAASTRSTSICPWCTRAIRPSNTCSATSPRWRSPP